MSQGSDGVLTLEQLVSFLKDQRTQPAGLVTDTPQRMRRGHPFPKRKIRCRARRNGFIGASFESVVNRQRAREGGPTSRDGVLLYYRARQLWRGQGEHVPGNRHLVRHRGTGELYLAFVPRTDPRGNLIESREYYYDPTADPRPDHGLVERFRQFSRGTKPGTKKRIPWRVFKLDHLREIRIGGWTYRIEATA